MENGINALLAKVAAGDAAALEALYRNLGNGVYCYALSLLSDAGAAEDVLQDTFVRVFSAAHGRKPGKSGKAWVYAIAKNLCFDRLRAKKRAAPMAEGGGPEDPADPAALDFVADTELKEALAGLDGDSRSIVLLHLASGLKFREIAALLERKQSKVEWAYYSAVRRLSEYYRV